MLAQTEEALLPRQTSEWSLLCDGHATVHEYTLMNDDNEWLMINEDDYFRDCKIIPKIAFLLYLYFQIYSRWWTA